MTDEPLADAAFGRARADELRRQRHDWWREHGIPPAEVSGRTSLSDALWLASLFRAHPDVLRPVLVDLLADEIGYIVADLTRRAK